MRTKRLIALAVACVAVSVAITAPVAAASNAVMAWGQNTEGQLCTGSTSPDGFALGEARGFGEVLAISPGLSHTLALLPNRTVMACGSNGSGQLGTATTEICEVPCSRVPVEVPAFKGGGVEAISGGYSHSLALKEGKVWSWGANNYGQLGRNTGTEKSSKTPAEVQGLPETERVIAISAGGNVSLALMQNHTLMAWGRNEYGDLGNGKSEELYNATPTPVVGVNGQLLENVEAMAAEGTGGIALLKGGGVATWGGDNLGTLGVGAFPGEGCPRDRTCSRKALVVTAVSGASAVSAVGGTDAVLLKNHTVMDWGYNYWGNLGDGKSGVDNDPEYNSKVPVPMCSAAGGAFPCTPEHQLRDVVGIATEQYNSMALLANGHVMTMGANRYGQLGVGEGILYSELPVEVPGLSEVTAIAGGGHSSYAVQNRP